MSDFDCLHRQFPIVCTCSFKQGYLTYCTKRHRLQAVKRPQIRSDAPGWRGHILKFDFCLSRYFVAYLTSFVAIAPGAFFRRRTKDPRRFLSDKFFKKALRTLAGVEDTDLSAYLNRKAAAWYLRFPPVHSPDRINDTNKARNAEGPEEEDAGDADEADVLLPMLSDDEDEDEPDGSGEKRSPNCIAFPAALIYSMPYSMLSYQTFQWYGKVLYHSCAI